MAPHDDPDHDPRPANPPLPPEDRLWRHPSELGPWSSGDGLTPAEVAGAGPARTPARGVLAGACLAGLLVVLGGLWLTRPGVEPGTDLASAPATTTSMAATTMVTPVAIAAIPIGRSQADSDPRPGSGRLGVEVGDFDGALVVAVVPDGPAARAGIADGDRIVAVDGQMVAHSTALLLALESTVPDQTVVVIVQRGTDLVHLPVTLG